MNVFRMTNIRDDTNWRQQFQAPTTITMASRMPMWVQIYTTFLYLGIWLLWYVKLIGFQLVKSKMNVFVWSGSQVLWPSLTAVVWSVPRQKLIGFQLVKCIKYGHPWQPIYLPFGVLLYESNSKSKVFSFCSIMQVTDNVQILHFWKKILIGRTYWLIKEHGTAWLSATPSINL